MTGAALRETAPGDRAAVLALYPLAFPEEDLRPIVSALLGSAHGHLSLGAFDGGALTGHVLFTFCDDNAALLAPLAVHPAHQRQGLGTALVRDGLARLTAQGIARVFLLGDPGYYGRLGFTPEREVTTPCPIPPDWAPAWQSLRLAPGGPGAGPLGVPEPWRDPALWQP